MLSHFDSLKHLILANRKDYFQKKTMDFYCCSCFNTNKLYRLSSCSQLTKHPLLDPYNWQSPMLIMTCLLTVYPNRFEAIWRLVKAR